ncbi:MAG: elongation factor Ts [Candidatus Omnitrophica bacterium]|nr:elongation factor Ts [Candidatus Omnitrophota bacterium]
MAAHKVSLDAIKALREKTGAAVSDVRKALESAGGNEAKAMEYLKRQSAAMAEKREGRATGQGRVESYVHHNGRLAALAEVNCETDFVARTEDFIQFCRHVALQVAAMNPRFVRAEEAPAGATLSPEEQKEQCLLEQAFIKDPSVTMKELLKQLIGKTGENVVIRRFVRFTLGE